MGIWRVPNGRVVPRRPLGFFIPILHYAESVFDQARPSNVSSSEVRGMLMPVWQLVTDIGFFPSISAQSSFYLAADVVLTASRHHTHSIGRMCFQQAFFYCHLYRASLFQALPEFIALWFAFAFVGCIALQDLFFYFMHLYLISPRPQSAWRIGFLLTPRSSPEAMPLI